MWTKLRSKGQQCYWMLGIKFIEKKKFSSRVLVWMQIFWNVAMASLKMASTAIPPFSQLLLQLFSLHYFQFGCFSHLFMLYLHFFLYPFLCFYLVLDFLHFFLTNLYPFQYSFISIVVFILHSLILCCFKYFYQSFLNFFENYL